MANIIECYTVPHEEFALTKLVNNCCSNQEREVFLLKNIYLLKLVNKCLGFVTGI